MYASYGVSWRARGDHSPLTTPRQPLRSFYIAERAARARVFLAVIARVFALALRLCFETILVSVGAMLSSLPALCISSLPALTSRLCRRSALTALVSVGALPCVCLCSALVSAVDSAPVSALLPSHLASATPLTRRVAFYISNQVTMTRLLNIERVLVYKYVNTAVFALSQSALTVFA